MPLDANPSAICCANDSGSCTTRRQNRQDIEAPVVAVSNEISCHDSESSHRPARAFRLNPRYHETLLVDAEQREAASASNTGA